MISPSGFPLTLRCFCSESFVLIPAGRLHRLLENAGFVFVFGFFFEVSKWGSALYAKHVLISFQNEQQVAAVKALEYLSEHLQDCHQLFGALKWEFNIFTRKEVFYLFFKNNLLYWGRCKTRDERLVSSLWCCALKPELLVSTDAPNSLKQMF